MKKMLALLLGIIMMIALTAPVSAFKADPTPAPLKLPEFKKAPIIRVWVKDINLTANISTSKLSVKDNPYVRYIFKNTGINVQIELQPEDSYMEKVQLVLNSKNAPDLISLTGLDSFAYGVAKAGALKPLNKYLPKYPNLMKVYNTAYWNEFSFDANKYFIMRPYELPVADRCTLIRQDWLDKLHLKMPTTVQEFHDVLAAFVKAQPDGQNPTYGLSGRVNLDNFWALTPAYGNPNIDTGKPYIYVDYTTKKLVLWHTSNAARAYYKEIVKWWKEGLIDKEFLNNNTDTFWSKVNNGVTGTVAHGAESAGWLTTWMRQIQKKTTPVLAVVPALKGTGFKNAYGGEGGTETMRAFDGYSGISRNCKNVDNVLKVLNFECSPAFNDFCLWGLEGMEYNTVNGVKIQDTDYKQTKAFYDMYVFCYDKSSFTPAQNDRIYQKYDGGGDKQYDPESDALARSRAAYIAVSKTAVPYQKWTNIIPGLPVEDLHPDVESPITALSVKLITGELDANKDADWNKYLSEVNKTGINDIIKEKEKYLKKYAPKYFTKW